MDYDYWTTNGDDDDDEMQLVDETPKTALEAAYADEDRMSASLLLREMRHESFQHQVIRTHQQQGSQQMRSVKIARCVA